MRASRGGETTLRRARICCHLKVAGSKPPAAISESFLLWHPSQYSLLVIMIYICGSPFISARFAGRRDNSQARKDLLSSEGRGFEAARRDL